ncbi:MAG: hypothetical protein LBV17_07655 [Treponema sp.]|nr:hypothetical protein [Treponema sp.]
MAQTSMLIAATGAAVGIGKAIGDYHDQQSMLKIQSETKRYQRGVEEAIVNGYTGYSKTKVIGTDGNENEIERFIGFDDYVMKDGTKLGDIRKGVEDYINDTYWTSGGKERGQQIAENAFGDVLLGAQKQLGAKVVKEREDAFNQLRTDAREVYRRTGDNTQFEAVYKGATWLGEDREKALRLEDERLIKLANIKDTAVVVAETKGTIAAKAYLAKEVKEKNINEDQEAEIYLAADKARAIAVKPEQDRLNGIWETETANATPATATSLRSVLRSKQREFEACDNQESYYKFMCRLNSASGTRERSGLSDSEIDKYNVNIMEGLWEDYKSGKIGIDQARAGMLALERTKWTVSETEEYYKKMIAYEDPLTAMAYERADELFKLYGADDEIKDKFKKVLTRMFTNNEVKSKDRIEFVEKSINEQIATYMTKALKSGASWSGKELKEQNALSYEGKLDPYFAPVGEDGRYEMEVPGADVMIENALKYSRDTIKDAIKATDMKYIDHEFEKEGKDASGRVFHIIEDSNGRREKVIVNRDGKLERAEDLSPFDSKLMIEKNTAISQFESELPEGFEEKIKAEFERGMNGTDDPLERCRNIIAKELGNKAHREIGKAYIDKKARELLGEGMMKIYGY